MSHKEETIYDLIESLEDREVIQMAYESMSELKATTIRITPLQKVLFNSLARENDRKFEEDVHFLSERFNKEFNALKSFEKSGLYPKEKIQIKKTELAEEYAEAVHIFKKEYAQGKWQLLCKYIKGYIQRNLFIYPKKVNGYTVSFNGMQHFGMN